MILNVKFAAIVSLATALMSSVASHASTFALAQLDRPSGIFGGAINEYIFNPVGPVERSIADPWGSAGTFALAEYGILKAKATASATDDPYGSFTARSGVGFSDQLTFTAAGLEGQAGTLNATIFFDRDLSHQGEPTGYARGDLSVATSFDTFYYQDLLSLQPSGCSVSAPPCQLQHTSSLAGTGTIQYVWQTPTSLALAIPFTFGQATDLSVSLDMQAVAFFTEGSSAWLADASHSLYWGGINSVSAASGQPVTFTVSSASGTDYLRSFAPAQVPEPSTLFLLIVGFIGLFAARRRFQQAMLAQVGI